MADDLPRWPNGDRKYESHFELEKQGLERGDYPFTKTCRCGALIEFWAPKGRTDWKAYDAQTTERHKCSWYKARQLY
jgi:hypothetical protein